MGNAVVLLLVGLVVGSTISNMLILGIFLLLYRHTHSNKTEENQYTPVIYPLSTGGGGERSLTFADLQRAAAALSAKKADKADDSKSADGGGTYI